MCFRAQSTESLDGQSLRQDNHDFDVFLFVPTEHSTSTIQQGKLENIIITIKSSKRHAFQYYRNYKLTNVEANENGIPLITHSSS